jgi:hypothetical protein
VWRLPKLHGRLPSNVDTALRGLMLMYIHAETVKQLVVSHNSVQFVESVRTTIRRMASVIYGS